MPNLPCKYNFRISLITRSQECTGWIQWLSNFSAYRFNVPDGLDALLRFPRWRWTRYLCMWWVRERFTVIAEVLFQRVLMLLEERFKRPHGATKHTACIYGYVIKHWVFFWLVSILRGSVLRFFRVRLRLDPPGVQNRLVHTCRSAWKLEGGMINPMCLMHVL